MTSYAFSQLIDFTRTSLGTYVNSSGFITTTPASTNLLTYTEAFNNAAWTKVTTTVSANSTTAPDGTPTADTLTASGINSTTRQTFTATAVPYTFSVYLKRKTGSGNIDITVDGTTYVTQAVTTDWVRFSTTLTPAAGSKTAGIRIAVSGDEVYAWGAQLELGSSASTYTKNYGGLYPPRFDYDPVALTAKGFLVEPQATNLCLYNSDLTNVVWTATSVTTAKTATGPDNVANSATTVTALLGNGTILQSITSASAARFTTCYIKRRTGTGTVEMTQDNGATWTTVTVTANWTRVSIPSATVTNPIIGLRLGTLGDAVDVWGFQCESSAYATSVIPTTNATVTRTADNATIQDTMFTQWYNSAAGTIVVEFDAGTTAAITPIPYQLSDGTSNNRILTSVGSAGTTMSTVITAAGAPQFSSTNAITYAQGTVYKTGAAVTTNSAVCSTGGLISAEDTSVTMPTITSLRLGASVFNSSYLAGHLRTVTYYPTRVTNSQLQAMTS